MAGQPEHVPGQPQNLANHPLLNPSGNQPLHAPGLNNNNQSQTGNNNPVRRGGGRHM